MTTIVTLDRAPGDGIGAAILRGVQRNGWVIGLYVTVGVMLLFTRAIHPTYGPFDLESLAQAALPVALAACAQAVVVIAGGIDLSVGSVMALTNVAAAVLMKNASEELSVAIVIGVLLMGVVVGAINGLLVVLTRVPDIVVTLAMSFVWAGSAILVLSSPGGGAADWVRALGDGSLIIEWIPRALVLLFVVVGVVWIPLRRSRLGLAFYAIGSDRLAAFRSGVDVDRTKVAAYALTGLFAAAGGLALAVSTGIGTPTAGAYTLLGVAAIVLGGVSLAGGRGGLLGPIAAAFILGLVRTDLVFLGVDPNYSTVIQGVIMVLVVMVGGLLELRRRRP